MFDVDVCVYVSGEDLVSEQTCQREEDKQEEAAAFPAGLHDYTHPPVLGGPADMGPHRSTSPSSNILSDTISEEY